MIDWNEQNVIDSPLKYDAKKNDVIDNARRNEEEDVQCITTYYNRLTYV